MSLTIHPRAIANHRELRRRLLAAVLVLHGIAHLAGLAVSGGVVAVAWSVMAAGFLGAAALAVRGDPRTRGVLAGVAVASLLLTVTALWAAWIGVVVDVALLAVLWRAPEMAGIDR